jgi:serine phosphatase RsbU (regulator of sigma subunit)/actin-like ATPase involved in cell morphogenesis
MSGEPDVVFGIDFGNSLSRIAYVDGNGRTIVVPNSFGEEATPSAVYFSGSRPVECVVGNIAKENSERYPERVVSEFKRSLGQEGFRFAVDGILYHSEELAAFVFRSLAVEAEKQTGIVVKDIVIAVPASFCDTEREAVRRAGEIAGLTVRSIISEPAAVAIEYGVTLGEDQTVLVYDLGGTTFSAALIEVRDAAVKVAGVVQDKQLGGLDWDQAIVRYLLTEAMREFGETGDIEGDRDLIQDLSGRAENAKRHLSESEATTVPVRWKGKTSRIELTRQRFEELTRDLLDSTMALTRRLISETKRQATGAVQKILLSGGATRMLQVARRLSEEFKVPCETHNSDHAVVRGAAIYGRKLADDPLKLEDTGGMVGNEENRHPWKSVRPMAAANNNAAVPSIAPDGQACHRAAKIVEALPAHNPQFDDDVEFTVYRPRVVQPQRWSTLLAFAHLSEPPDDAPPERNDPVAEVRRQAEQILGPDRMDEFKSGRQESRLAVPREGELTMVPYLPGFECNPPRYSFLWQEDVHRCEFRIRAGAHLDGQTVAGWMSVFLGSILLAEVTMKIRVDSEHVEPATRPPQDVSRSRPYKKVFASYSHRDRVIVEQFESLHRAMGDRFLRDWNELRAGEEWNERLMEMIHEADVFQLFWSRHAMQSPFVRQEYEYAMSLKRPSFIRPCYWEDPFPESSDDELPPSTLRRFHFQKIEMRPLPASDEHSRSAASPETLPSSPHEESTVGINLGFATSKRMVGATIGAGKSEANRSGSPTAVLERVLDSLFVTFPQADEAVVVLKDSVRGTLRVEAMKSRRTDAEPNIQVSLPDLQDAMRTGKASLSVDAAGDSRFEMSQSISNLSMRSMMCVPLMGTEGEPLGVVQIDTRDIRRQFSQSDLNAIVSLVSQASLAIENARLRTALERQRAGETDLELARSLQPDFLPPQPPGRTGYQFGDHYETSDVVGGDYYDYIELPGNRMAIAIGDVAGKGVQAAPLAARLPSLIRQHFLVNPSPGKALAGLNSELASSDIGHRFITLVIVVLDPDQETLTVANAGHLRPLLRSAAGVVDFVGPRDSAGLPIGILPDQTFEEIVVPFRPGDSLVLYTDGVTDAMNSGEEIYGMERLARSIASGPSDAASIIRSIASDSAAFRGNRGLHDDMALVCVSRIPRNEGDSSSLSVSSVSTAGLRDDGVLLPE